MIFGLTYENNPHNTPTYHIGANQTVVIFSKINAERFQDSCPFMVHVTCSLQDMTMEALTQHHIKVQ